MNIQHLQPKCLKVSNSMNQLFALNEFHVQISLGRNNFFLVCLRKECAGSVRILNLNCRNGEK